MPQTTKSLPARPDLEHLRKQAKRRLRALRAVEPRAKLADAQLAVAREYGFASWKKLSAHVESTRAAPPVVDAEQLARNAVGSMERAWAESFALIERRFDRAGELPRWEAVDLHSPTLLERQADAWIVARKQLGLYRMTSLWHAATITQKGRAILQFAPTRVLEFFRGGNPQSAPAGGIWRRIDWEPTRTGFTGKPGRLDDLAEALTYLRERAPLGEYRVITVRRMLRAEQAKERMKIIKKHADVKSCRPLGVAGEVSRGKIRNADWKPIMDASFRGDAARVKVLLAAGADPNIVSATGHRYRPLHRAIEPKKTHPRGVEHEAVVQALLAGGADPKRRGTWSQLTALQLAATGEWRFVRLLRSHFEPLDIFHAAAVAADSRVATLLKSNSKLATSQDVNGWTALHYCCASMAFAKGQAQVSAQVRITKMLVDHGADPEAKWTFDSKWPIPPLYHCCGQHDNPAVAEVLFKAGAKPYDNETVYHASDEDHRGALELIERYSEPKLLAEECTRCMLTQLHWGRVRGVPWLLAHGADPHWKNESGNSAFDLAARKPRILKLLEGSKS
jgi:ankyrin repeat protein